MEPSNTSDPQEQETKVSITAGYPGLGLPLTYNPQQDHDFYPLGADTNSWDSCSDMLPVRELAMMSIMEQLTDKEDWSRKIFDEQIVAKWRQEALSIPDKEFWGAAFRAKAWARPGQLPKDEADDWIEPLEGIVSSRTFDYCVDELRDKADHYNETGIIPTLDACASVAKSDKLVSPELHNALRLAFDQLKADQTPDWHPNSNDMVQDLVHPSMYPLVYGRSRVFKDEVVGVRDAISAWAGKSEVIPKPSRKHQGDRHGPDVPPEFWSETYQWLPSNIAFQEGGRVRFTSYINNLHPNKYPDIYRTIETLLEKALPMWDQCLCLSLSGSEGRVGAGRTESRFPIPENPSDDNPENWVPSDPDEIPDEEINMEELEDYDPEYLKDLKESARHAKWLSLRKRRIPEPIFQVIDYTPKPGYRLAERFRQSGLQVIVKMASIELTPEKPEFPAGGWHVEGQMNEHICATALYYLDSDNITSSSLSFRMQTTHHCFKNTYQYLFGRGNSCGWIESVYGIRAEGGGSCIQNYGEVQTREGRLLAFPNVFQHRVSPFRLIDPTKPGHRRFIALWLVDPNKRIISTANVPPQQLSWWTEAVLGSGDAEARATALSKFPPELVALLAEKGVDVQSPPKGGRLPPELMDRVREYFEEDDSSPLGMTEAEAQHHRLELMRERTNYQEAAGDSWSRQTYSFCEH